MAYIDILYKSILFFIGFSILTLPMVYVYQQGAAYEEDQYNRAIAMCALQPDLARLPGNYMAITQQPYDHHRATHSHHRAIMRPRRFITEHS